MSPYVFGMLAALKHRQDKEHKYLDNSSVLLEWIAFVGFVAIGFSGVTPDGKHLNSNFTFLT